MPLIAGIVMAAYLLAVNHLYMDYFHAGKKKEAVSMSVALVDKDIPSW